MSLVKSSVIISNCDIIITDPYIKDIEVRLALNLRYKKGGENQVASSPYGLCASCYTIFRLELRGKLYNKAYCSYC
jgi:hypothetical protein